MSQMHYYYLILRYPSLRKFLTECYMNYLEEKIYDLLIDLETEDVR